MGSNSTRGGGGDGNARPWPLGRTRWAIAGMILGVIGSSWVGVGRRWPEVPAGEADGMIDGAVRKVARGIEGAATGVRARYNEARGASRNAALVAEVNARLRQDKSLEADQIDVSVEGEGAVILEGQVRDGASKELAVDLARDIRGVVRVEDRLAIPPRSRVFTAASDDDASTAARPRRTR